MKKSWTRPKLIVLFRGKPEERVLTACKNGYGSASGGVQGNCTADHYQGDTTLSCVNCSEIVAT